MSVELTRLPSGLTVITDDMPHLETASLGVWVWAAIGVTVCALVFELARALPRRV